MLRRVWWAIVELCLFGVDTIREVRDGEPLDMRGRASAYWWVVTHQNELGAPRPGVH